MEVSNKIDQETNEYGGNDRTKESNSYGTNSDSSTSESLSASQLGIYFFFEKFNISSMLIFFNH